MESQASKDRPPTHLWCRRRAQPRQRRPENRVALSRPPLVYAASRLAGVGAIERRPTEAVSAPSPGWTIYDSAHSDRTDRPTRVPGRSGLVPCRGSARLLLRQSLATGARPGADPPSRWRLVPIWGLIVAACVVGGAWPFVDTGPLVALGIAVLSIGGELVGRGRWWGVFLIGGGAAAVALADGIPDVWWVRVGTVLFIGIGGWAIGRLPAVLADTGVPALMVAGTAFGVWATVPDTEIAATFLGALTPLVFTAWPQVRAI